MKGTCLLLGLGILACGGQTLEEGFRTPPMSARPQAWWHWMNGNVTKEGITADLEAMAEIGLGGATVFDVGCTVPPGPLKFSSPEWFETVGHAAREARRLGLELIVPTCSGWSSSGGPWITPERGMKFLEHVEALVSGPRRFEEPLPALPNPHGFVEDIAVLAVPVPAAERTTMDAAGVRVSELGPHARLLSFERPFAASGFSYRLDYPQFWSNGNDGEVTVEVSDDGESFRTILQTEATLVRRNDSDRSLRYERFPQDVTSRHFRISFAFRIKNVRLAELSLGRRLSLTHLADKTLHNRMTLRRDGEGASDQVVRREDVRDVTRFLGADGVLRWDVPEGDWRIIRLGYAANGRKNAPASDCGAGLEVDKLSATALDFHFEQYVGRLVRQLGDCAGNGPSGLHGVLVDSYEVGGQNWTQGFEDEFARRRGYDMTPYLPVLAGTVVGSVDESERFLADFRRTVADLFAAGYSGALARKCHACGLKLSLEPYGNCPCDDLEYGDCVDIPQGEFWSRVVRDGPHGTSAGNVKMPSYLEHVWGRRYCAAEAFTADPHEGGRWLTTPAALKAQGDRVFTKGVNRLVFHRFAHQPWTKPARLPGMTMGRWGMHLDRTQTWWKQGRAWMDYLSRCQWMLQEGTFCADVLFWHGEEVPSRGGHIVDYPEDFADHPVPDGYDRDVCSTPALMKLRVENGKIVAPGGVRYSLLVLQDVDEMSPEALEAVRRILETGGRVAAPRRPVRMPGLRDYPRGDAHIDRMSSEIWSKGVIAGAAKEGLAAIGLGRDFVCLDAPDGMKAETAWIHRAYPGDVDAYFVAAPNAKEGFFTCAFRVDGREPELWDAETGKTGRQPVRWRRQGGVTEVTFRLPPNGSAFVVFRKPTDRLSGGADDLGLTTIRGKLPVASWRLEFPVGWYSGSPEMKSVALGRLADWTTLDDPDMKYFSGTATYGTTVPVRRLAADERLVLDLGEVREFAEVTVNGRSFPVLWKPPYRLDITSSLASGATNLEISVRVTNLWPNRLIGDDRQHAEDCVWSRSGERGPKDISLAEMPDWVRKGEPSPTGRHTFTTWKHWSKEDDLLPSGLLGPVELRVEADAAYAVAFNGDAAVVRMCCDTNTATGGPAGTASYVTWPSGVALGAVVTVGRPFTNAVVRPRSAGVKTQVRGDKVYFSLPHRAGRYLLETEGTDHPLYLVVEGTGEAVDLPQSAFDRRAFEDPPRLPLSRPDARHSAATRRHTGIPSVAAARNGRLWTTYYGGPTGGEDSNNYCVLATSADGGRTWADVLVADPDGEGPVRSFDPLVWIAPDGRLFWTWTERTVPLKRDVPDPSAGCLADPKDDRLVGVTLDAAKVPAAPFPEPMSIGRGVMLGKPVVLKDGRWLLPTARWGETNSAFVCATDDGGKTFVPMGGAGLPSWLREFDEHCLLELKNGCVRSYLRARTGPCGCWMSESADGGRTWTASHPANFPHTNSRLFVRRLASGSVLLVKNGTLGADTGRDNLTAFLSDDDGETWRGGLLIDARTGVSYPDGDQDATGVIHVTHDHDRLGQQEILVSSFTEADVRAGRLVTPGSSLCRRVTSAPDVGKEGTPAFARARPVWAEGEATAMNAFVGLRAVFEAKVAARAVLRVTCAYDYRARLNGSFVGFGPVRAPKGVFRIDEWPLDVVVGTNVVEVEAAGYNCNSFYFIDQPAFVTAEVVVDGRVVAQTGTDGEFRPYDAGRIRKVPRYSGQRTFIDAWRVGGKACALKPLVEQPAVAYEMRPLARPDFAVNRSFHPIRTSRLVREAKALDVKVPFIEPDPIDHPPWKVFPVCELETNPYYELMRCEVASRTGDAFALKSGDATLFEGDRNASGFFGLRVCAEGPCRVLLAFDEMLSEGGRLDFTRLDCANAVEWRIAGSGTYELETFEPYAAKFIGVAVLDGNAAISAPWVRTYASPLADRTTFRASDPALERIFLAARESFRANAVDGFTDCPTRERACWTGDTFFTARAAGWLGGDGSVERTFLGNFLLPGPSFDWSGYDAKGVNMYGAIPALYPGDVFWGNFIPNYMIWTILQTEAYVRRYGDTAFAEKARERILGIVSFLEKFRNSDGLLEHLPGWVFVEWSKANQLVQDVNYPSSMMYAAALEAVSRLYALPRYADEATAIRREIVRQSWTGEWFCDNAVRQPDGSLRLSGECTETCQYCAFFFGTVTPESHPGLWRRLLDEFGPCRAKNGLHPEIWPCNFIFGTCERLELLSRAGRSRQVLEETRDYFLKMAERTGTLWEHLDDRASCCHGFSSIAAEYLFRDILGVRELDRVRRTVRVDPAVDMPLDWCEGTIPVSPEAAVTVKWRKSEGRPVVEIELPDGWSRR